MVALGGMFFQNGLRGSTRGDVARYTGSPLRDFHWLQSRAFPTAGLPLPRRRPLGAVDQGLRRFCLFSCGLENYRTGTPGNDCFEGPTSGAPEIANGRSAMVAIIGILPQDGLADSAEGDLSPFMDSPLRALGVSRRWPVGDGDPLHDVLPRRP